MEKDILFTTGQFARLHHLNKRTLHYYDEIGLFSPAHKGQNDYRYYTWSQSAELENILALRELGMSIGEIKDYIAAPGPAAFGRIAEQKTQEIDKQMRHLNNLKKFLHEKQDALHICDKIYDGMIEIARLPKRDLLLTPIVLEDEDFFNMEYIMEHLRTAWEYNTFKTGCGSYISLDKVKQDDFSTYDGLFTPVVKPPQKEYFKTRPEGEYLCGYSIGNWDKLPPLYRQMLAYAQKEGLELTGDCYETGLNEFAISSAEEYVTQVVIQIL